MPLIPATCPGCGGAIELDRSRATAKCPYCGKTFFVEKAITHSTTINRFEGLTVVNVMGENADNLVDLALSYLEVGNLSLALSNAEKALGLDAKNGKAWMIKAICTVDDEAPLTVLKYAKKAVELCDDPEVTDSMQNLCWDLTKKRIPCSWSSDDFALVLSLLEEMGFAGCYREVHIEKNYSNLAIALDGYSSHNQTTAYVHKDVDHVVSTSDAKATIPAGDSNVTIRVRRPIIGYDRIVIE